MKSCTGPSKLLVFCTAPGANAQVSGGGFAVPKSNGSAIFRFYHQSYQPSKPGGYHGCCCPVFPQLLLPVVTCTQVTKNLKSASFGETAEQTLASAFRVPPRCLFLHRLTCSLSTCLCPTASPAIASAGSRTIALRRLVHGSIFTCRALLDLPDPNSGNSTGVFPPLGIEVATTAKPALTLPRCCVVDNARRPGTFRQCAADNSTASLPWGISPGSSPSEYRIGDSLCAPIATDLAAPDAPNLPWLLLEPRVTVQHGPLYECQQ